MHIAPQKSESLKDLNEKLELFFQPSANSCSDSMLSVLL